MVLEHRGRPPSQKVWVDSIIIGTPVDQCGQIKVGDYVLEINGAKMNTTPMAEGASMLTSPAVRLVLLRKEGNVKGDTKPVSMDEMSMDEQLWCGPCFARFPGRTRRLSQEWETMNFSTAQDAFCLYDSHQKDPRLGIELTHQHYITQPSNQGYSSTGSLDVFSIGCRGGTFGDKRLVKIGSAEPGVVSRLAERIESVIKSKKLAYRRETGRDSGASRKASQHKV
jgi:hypothetical protein